MILLVLAALVGSALYVVGVLPSGRPCADVAAGSIVAVLNCEVRR